MNTNYSGVLLLLLATLLFAILDSSSKFLTAAFAVPLIVWMRYLTNLGFMLLIVPSAQRRELVRTSRPGLSILRGVAHAISSLFVVLAFSTLPLAETTSLVFTTPLLVALFSGPLLGEKVSLPHWLGIIAGFVGVLLIVRPGGAMSGIGVFYALACALFYALYQILTRKLASTEPPMRQLFYSAFSGTLLLSCIVPFYWRNVLPTFPQMCIILSLGIYGGVGHFLVNRAFREVPAALLSPLLYSQLVWATLLGWLVFAQLPDLLALAGMVVIAASSLGLVLDQRRSRPGREA